MKLQKLEAYIDTKIVQRGQSYFASGMVEELEESENDFWQAWVTGTDEYDIEVGLSGDEVKYWSCTCPYDFGPICKHVVATLMTIREQKERTLPNKGTNPAVKRPSKAEQLNQVLQSLSRDELESTIRDLLKGERRLLENFLLRFQHMTGNSGNLSKRYQSLFNNILFNYSDHGFIEYNAAGGFANEVEELLGTLFNDDTPAIDRVDCCLVIAEGLVEDVVNGIDDSNGELGNINYQMHDILEAAWSGLSSEQQAYCFGRTLECHYGLEEYGLEAFEPLLAIWCVDNADHQALYLKELDRQIERKSGWSKEYRLSKKYDLLMQWGHVKEAVELAGQYMDISKFREYFVQQAIDENNISKARQLIEEGIAIAERENSLGVVNRWREMLLAMAEQSDDLPAVRQELLRLMENCWFRLDLYKKYKSTYTAQEWETERHKLYETIQAKGANVDVLATILDEENELEPLFRLIHAQKHGAISLFKRYARRLSAEFPEETVATYVRAIRVNMKQTGRGVYEQAAKDMEELATFPGGKEAMQLLLADLCVQYKNRKAMLEIFRRVFR
ncbi:MAG: SWIM zinc finger family protein [Thiolinea sp.]